MVAMSAPSTPPAGGRRRFVLLAVVGFLVPILQHLPQPSDLLFGHASRSLATLLVTPVRGDAQLGALMHLVRANLYFQRAALGTDYRSVQRLITVRLGVRDIIVEFLVNVVPKRVHRTKRGIAVIDRANDHPHRPHVENLLEGQILALHLPPDAIDVLHPTTDLGNDTGLPQAAPQFLHHPSDVAFPIGAALVERSGDLLVNRRIQIAQG